MAANLLSQIFLSSLLLLVVISASAQTTDESGIPPIAPTPSNDDRPRSIREALIKQNIDRQRREHEAMLKRGEDAVKLVESLTASYETKHTLSAQDKKNLESLERLVRRIRSDLGGRDDGGKALTFNAEDDEDDNGDRPGDVKEAFLYLKNKTEELVEELRKSTRFSISATAISSTNSVIRLARFLRSF